MHSGVLHVFILSVCLGQVNFHYRFMQSLAFSLSTFSCIHIQILTVSAGIINPWHYYIRERIYGVSEQFVDDYKFLCDKSSNDSNALSWLDHPLVSKTFAIRLFFRAKISLTISFTRNTEQRLLKF